MGDTDSVDEVPELRIRVLGFSPTLPTREIRKASQFDTDR